MTRPALLLAILSYSGCVDLDPKNDSGGDSEHEDSPDDSGDSGSDSGEDSGGDSGVDSGDSGNSGDSGDVGDSGDTGDTGDTGLPCEGCTGILTVTPEVVLQADGTDTDTATAEIRGWTTGITARCDASLVHLTYALAETDTSTSGYTTLSFGVSGGFSGSESGVCSVSSDYGSTFTINVALVPCEDCTGVTGCDEDDLILTTYSTGYPSRSTTCTGTATGITVSCATSTGGVFTRFSTALSTTDSSTSGAFLFTVSASDVFYFSEWGTCTISSDQPPTLDICVWECNTGSCVSPC